MAELVLEGDQVVLRLTTRERLLAAHRDVRVPLSAVTSVESSKHPSSGSEGCDPGAPRWSAGTGRACSPTGSFFDGTVHRRLFAAVGGRTRRGVEVGLDDARDSRLVVSLDQPEVTKAALTARRPPRPS